MLDQVAREVAARLDAHRLRDGRAKAITVVIDEGWALTRSDPGERSAQDGLARARMATVLPWLADNGPDASVQVVYATQSLTGDLTDTRLAQACSTTVLLARSSCEVWESQLAQLPRRRNRREHLVRWMNHDLDHYRIGVNTAGLVHVARIVDDEGTGA
ncbi:hypothetical protein [Cellulosimicrobium sp. Marseille-Q4280]|uniref:hypothetical protein n=1 Tax=Cellulosimicrobium sp. Marseille-Q4280 TaxID=2937992 RepID=UPI00203A7552|nr:hypothetical protein [Cellulosimicrobium sp. Marseille-Q4280]